VVMTLRRSTTRLRGMVFSGKCGCMSGLLRVRFEDGELQVMLLMESMLENESGSGGGNSWKFIRKESKA